MTDTTITIRTNAELKEQASDLFESFGACKGLLTDGEPAELDFAADVAREPL